MRRRLQNLRNLWRIRNLQIYKLYLTTKIYTNLLELHWKEQLELFNGRLIRMDGGVNLVLIEELALESNMISLTLLHITESSRKS
jgi:hypothetical protein